MDSSLNSYSSASLAYLGDCAIEICVREYLVSECGFSSSAKLNKAALDFVRAPKQAEAMKNILPDGKRRDPERFSLLGRRNVFPEPDGRTE